MNRSEAGKLGALASHISRAKIKALIIEEYLKNPKLCLTCNASINFSKRLKSKFCSRSCAASFNGSAFPKRKKTAPRCLDCGRLHNRDSSRCQKCNTEYLIGLGLVKGRERLKRWLANKNGRMCECCKNINWMDKPIPLELDHKDGNPYNDLPNNIRLLCPNCHAQTPTAKGKNKGNGRFSRRQRYAEGKSS